MFKTIWVISFREDVSREDAERHWRESHAELMLKIPGVVRYVQSRSVEQLLPGFDGVAELWFESRAAYDAALAEPEWVAAVADNARFIDVDKLSSAIVEQTVVKGT